MNVNNLEKVNVKILLENHDGSTVECFEKGIRISDDFILSVYENGVEINEFQYDQAGDIVLGDEILGLQGKVDESAIDLQPLATMSAIDFLLAISPVNKGVSVCGD